MKKYLVTEKQLEALKKNYEKLNDLPQDIDDGINEAITAEGGRPINGIKESVIASMADTAPDFKYFIEDIEAQELDIKLEDEVVAPGACQKIIIATYVPKVGL